MKFKKNNEYKTIKKAAAKLKPFPPEEKLINPTMPAFIKIDTVRYKVEEKPLLLDGNEKIAGRITYSDSLIEISNDRSEDQKRITLMHEIVHGVLTNRDLSKHFNREIGETICDEVAKSFIQIIRDNKELIEYLK